MNYRLIDISQFQGIIDWQKVKNAGYTAAMIRVGGRYGGSGLIYPDKYAKTNLQNAINAGLKVGAYFFTQAVNEKEAREEAQYTVSIIKNFKITMPVAIDTESLANGRHNKITRVQRTNVCKVFCEEIKSAGYIPMIYASLAWFNNYLDDSQLKVYEHWVAQWSKNLTFKGKCGIWQYSENGKVNGIRGNVDLNLGFIEYWTGKIPEEEKPEPVKKLKITSELDKDTIKALQRWMGTTVDGVISGQHPLNKKDVPALKSATWEGTGSSVVKALQRMLNGKGYDAGAVDGLLGPKTITALQKFLNKNTKENLAEDGILGPKTSAALQRYLNLL